MKENKKNRDKKSMSRTGKIIFRASQTIERLEQAAPIRKTIDRERASIRARCGSDEGYASYALALNITRIFLVVILIISIILGLMFSGGRFKVDNIYYMSRDIAYMNSYSERAANILNYTKAQQNGDFGLYKNGLAVACNSEVKLFNATGRVTLTSGDIFACPVIVSSNKNLIVYDLGGSKLSVYNSFKKLRTLTFDGGIADVAMSENGNFAVAVKSQNYNSVVHIYNDGCEEISTYSSNKYTVSTQMSPDGKYIAVIGATASSGSMSAQLTVLKGSKNKIYAQLDIGELTPYTCRILDGDRVAVICSDRVCVYSLKGKLKGEYIYPDAQLSYISSGEDSLSLLFEDDLVNGQNTLTVLNKNGRSVYSGAIRGTFTDMQMYGDHVFLLTNNGITKFNYKTKITTFKQSENTFGRILACDKGRVLLCTDSYGIYFDIE